MKIILASASPRRREILLRAGIKDFETAVCPHEAQPPDGAEPEEAVKAIALSKALWAEERYCPGHVVIAADTLVFLDGKRLGKPRDARDAERMLRALSGREHHVMTGLAVTDGVRREVLAESTAVRFRDMTDEEIRWYVAGGEPMDKAGAYGIQGAGGIFVEGITGDYYNVMGLPLCRLFTVLRGFGMPLGAQADGKGDLN